MRPVSRELTESRKPSLMRDSVNLKSYNGTSANKVDTSFYPNSTDDIDDRFGASTHQSINNQFDTFEDLETRFSDQFGSNRGRVGLPPKGIFDDV